MGCESALKFYEAARAEILMRMQLRDAALGLYLTGAGTLLALYLGQPPNIQSDNSVQGYLLVIPLISAAVAAIVGHHSLICGLLAEYCARELAPHVADGVPQWDGSRVARSFRGAAIAWRSIAEGFVLIAPAVVALALAWRAVRAEHPAWWMASAAAAAAALALTAWAATARARIFRRIDADALPACRRCPP